MLLQGQEDTGHAHVRRQQPGRCALQPGQTVLVRRLASQAANGVLDLQTRPAEAGLRQGRVGARLRALSQLCGAQITTHPARTHQPQRSHQAQTPPPP